MADARTCIKGPDEALTEFNKRLKAECADFEPTDVQIYVVDGEPMVVLSAETAEANDEDVADAKAHGESIKVGDEIPDGDLVTVKVAKISAWETPKQAVSAKNSRDKSGYTGMSIASISEDRLDKVYGEAKGLITKHLIATGLVPVPLREYEGQVTNWVAVVYVPIEEEGDEAQATAEGESALKS